MRCILTYINLSIRQLRLVIYVTFSTINTYLIYILVHSGQLRIPVFGTNREICSFRNVCFTVLQVTITTPICNSRCLVRYLVRYT